MTIFGLLATSVPLWNGTGISNHGWYWTWSFMIGASLCALIAPLVYLYVPTEWSLYMNVGAGAVQAFVNLQITLVANKKEKRSLKRE